MKQQNNNTLRVCYRLSHDDFHCYCKMAIPADYSRGRYRDFAQHGWLYCTKQSEIWHGGVNLIGQHFYAIFYFHYVIWNAARSVSLAQILIEFSVVYIFLHAVFPPLGEVLEVPKIGCVAILPVLQWLSIAYNFYFHCKYENMAFASNSIFHDFASKGMCSVLDGILQMWCLLS